VNVIYDDPDFNNGTALSMVEALVAQDKVAAIFSDTSTSETWDTYVQKQGVPVIGVNSSSQAFVTSSDFFAEGQTLDDYFTNFIEAAKKVSAKNIGVFYCAEAITCQEIVPPLKTTAAKLNFPVSYVSSVSSSAPSYAAPCIAAQQAGTQALTIATGTAAAAAIASGCNAQGYKPWYIALDGAVANIYTSTPGLSTHFIGSETDYPWFLNNIPAMKTMVSALKKYSPSVLTDPNYGEIVVQAWATGMEFTTALQSGKIGSNGAAVTPAGVKKGLYSLKGATMGGLTPPLTYHKGVPNPVDCWYWIRTVNGKFAAPYGTKPICGKPVPLS
jgi:branched-chain amino acid transport system substrate-binding protein